MSGLNAVATTVNWPRPQFARDFPYLTKDNSRITSNLTFRYNCIAWAAGENTRYWWPDPQGVGYWPKGVKRDVTVDAFVAAYETRKFKVWFGGALEEGVEKIALYGKTQSGMTVPTHAALQQDDGEWTSKLGPYEDIVHANPDDVCGPLYGQVILFMGRARSTNI